MGCNCGGHGGVNRAMYGVARGSPAKPVLGGQARARRLASMIEEQNKATENERKTILRKRQAAILRNMKRAQ